MNSKLYFKAPKVLAANKGIIIEVQRPMDKAIICRGQKTQSGTIKNLLWDTDFSGEMACEMEPGGTYVALSAINI